MFDIDVCKLSIPRKKNHVTKNGSTDEISSTVTGMASILKAFLKGDYLLFTINTYVCSRYILG